VARGFVAIDDKLGIAGFYSLTSFTLAIANLPIEHTKRLSRYDVIPAALVGRLARDERVHGEGIGDLLLADAVRGVIGVSQSLAVFAIVVEATDEKAAAFYSDFGFVPFPIHPLRLFMTVYAVAAAISCAVSR
jgi:GNAT superfamily N-acetyltransferase